MLIGKERVSYLLRKGGLHRAMVIVGRERLPGNVKSLGEAA